MMTVGEEFSLALSLLNLQVMFSAMAGPWVAGTLFTATRSYVPMFFEILLLAAAAWVVLAWIRRLVS